ncbi:hypothetical protein HanOQP8_Chr17g0664811 [Helianthus annuus]|nr:hypothetical protein HanOQP8_Chr17g0664811 [Helianthus annuus]
MCRSSHSRLTGRYFLETHFGEKLTDLARYARIFKLRLSKEVIQGLEGVTSSWTGYIPLNLVLF